MDGQNTKNTWREVLESIKVSVSPAIFSTWFSQTHLINIKKENGTSTAEIGCSSAFVKTTIEERYHGLIRKALEQSINSPCEVVFAVKENPDSWSKTPKTSTPLFEEQKISNNDSFANSRVREYSTFANFAVSSSNQMAWAAAEAVAQNPGKAYNPLFLWGGVGVGKTHLMNAVGYEVLSKDAGKKVYFCSGEEFTNDIVEGIRQKTTQAFRNKYRKLNTLLIDDIQFIAGKDAVQEEFFHTFNSLVATGAQIILTSDRSPSDISKLEERLRSRFEAGLIVDIAPPDFELRCAIAQIKSREKGLEIPMECIQLIAGNVDSARKIEGFLVRLITEAHLKSTEISLELVQSLLGRGVDPQESSRKSTPIELFNAVSAYYAIGKRALVGNSRARPVALPRQVLMYLLRTQLGLPLEEVGRIVGNRDHTTVMHAVNKITNLVSESVQIREDIQGIKRSL